LSFSSQRLLMTTSTPEHVPASGWRAVLAVLGASALLCACAMAPGMRMQTQSDPEAAEADAAPAGALTPITAELIARQREAATQGVGKEIKSLFGTRKAYRIGRNDIVNVVVWGHPELGLTPATSNRSMGSTTQADVGNGYNVNPDGT